MVLFDILRLGGICFFSVIFQLKRLRYSCDDPFRASHLYRLLHRTCEEQQFLTKASFSVIITSVSLVTNQMMLQIKRTGRSGKSAVSTVQRSRRWDANKRAVNVNYCFLQPSSPSHKGGWQCSCLLDGGGSPTAW